MADLATITIPVDSSAMVRAVKDAKSLERGIKMLVDAFDSGTIGSQQLSKGLLQLKRQYEGLFGTSQKATASVRGHAKSLQESKAAAAAATAAEERLILAKKKAETAYSLGMQRAKEEARAIAELDRVKQASAAREDMLRQKYDESYRAMVIYRTQIKELNEALSVGALNQGAYKERIEQLNQSLANGTIVMGGYAAQASTGMNKFGVAAQQTGYQVSDFLVQVQGGTNPLVAFSQQATQLAGLLYLMPERFQMARLAVLGFSVSVATAISVVTIGIPLLAMLAMNFFSSGEKAEDGAKGIDKYKEAIEGLKSAISNVQEEINKLTFGTEDAAIAGARKAMVDAQAEIAALMASQRKVRGVAAPTAEEQAAIDKAVASYRELVVNLNQLNAKQAALAEAQNMLNGGLSVASGIQKALVYQKENELRVARELAAEADTILKKLDRLTRLDLADMFNSAAVSVGTMNARLDSTLVKLRGILGAIGSIGFDTVGIQAETKALQAGMSQAQARVEAQVARMEASLAQSGETGALAAAGLATYRKALEDNAAAQEALTKEVDARTEATKGGAKADKEATKAAEALRKELESPLVNAVGSISDAFGDFVARGLTDFKGFVKSILGSFQSMIAQMIAMAVKNRIMLSLGIGGLTPTMAAAGQIPGIGAAGGMLGSFGGGAGMAGLAGGTGFLGGFGNVVGGLASGGLAGAGGAIGGALGSGSFAMAAGAIAAPLLAVAAVFSFFKKKTKELDSGLRITVTNMDALVETFKTVQTTRFFGLSKKTTTTVGEAGAEISDPIVKAVQDIQTQVLKAAEMFGIAESEFADFVYKFDLSLKGLTDEQKIQKVNEELLKMGDAFASLSGQFTTMNELLAAAQQRYDLQTRLLELQGDTEALLARQRELELAAVHDLNLALLQQIHTLEDQKKLEAERLEIERQALAAAQEAAQQLQRLSQERTSLEVKILELQGNAVDALRIQREKEIAAVDESNRGLLRLTFALEDYNQAVANTASAAANLRSAMDRELAGAQSAMDAARGQLEKAVERRVATIQSGFARIFASIEAQIDSAKAKAESSRRIFELLDNALSGRSAVSEAGAFASRRAAMTYVSSGGMDVDKLTSALGVLNEPSEQFFGTFQDYARDFALTTNAIEQSRAVAEASMTADEKAVQLLEQSLEQQRASEAAQIAAVEKLLVVNEQVLTVEEAMVEYLAAQATYEQMQTQHQELIAQFPMLNESVLSVADAIIALSAAVAAQTAAQTAVANAIASAANVSTGDVPGFASGGMFSGGPRIVGENGPELEVTGPSRIYSNRDTANMFRDPELASAVDGLRREVSGMRSEQLQIQVEVSKNVKRIYDIERKWDTDGLPPERV